MITAFSYIFLYINFTLSLFLNNQVPTTGVYIFILLFYLDGPGSSMSVSPSEGPFTKTQGQSMGPIVCSAQCDPPC
jgi:hypothetical protein